MIRALSYAHAIKYAAETLLAEVKEESDNISVEEARLIASKVREAEGYLQSVRKALRSEGGL